MCSHRMSNGVFLAHLLIEKYFITVIFPTITKFLNIQIFVLTLRRLYHIKLLSTYHNLLRPNCVNLKYCVFITTVHSKRQIL